MAFQNLSQAADRLLLIAVCALLVLCFVSGGSSQHTNLAVTATQLFALPMLLYALSRLWRDGHTVVPRIALIALALIVAVPLLQLLPIPQALWNLPTWRSGLHRDLAAMGVTGIDFRWTLTPGATEQAFLSILPAVAIFTATISLPSHALRKLLWMIVGLALFNLVLAIAQLLGPRDGILNPYPDFAPSMGGIFANSNHQATLLAVALVLSVAFVLNARRRNEIRGSYPALSIWLFGALAAVFALSMPSVGSRAGMFIALPSLLLLVLPSGGDRDGRARVNWRAWFAWSAGAVTFVIAAYGASRWIAFEAALEGSRWAATQQTFALAVANAPLGSGIGSFVPIFLQGAEISTRMKPFFNHAHDEYVQWLLEAGPAAVVVLIAVFAALIAALRQLIRLPADSRLRTTGLAALAGILVILVHSLVDYPLRTPAMMAVSGALAGVATAAGARAAERSAAARNRHGSADSRGNSDAALAAPDPI